MHKGLTIIIAIIMSIQVLLPKDTAVRALCSCIDNENLPVKYQTRNTSTKERDASTLLDGELSDIVLSSLEQISKIFDKGELDASKSITRTSLDPNYQLWRFLEKVIKVDNFLPLLPSDISNTIDTDAISCLKLSVTRLGSWITNSTKQACLEQIEDVLPDFVSFEKAARSLEMIRDGYNSTYRTKVKNWKRNGSMGKIDISDIHGKTNPLKYFQVGRLVVLIMKDNYDRTDSFIMTNVHYSRIIEILRSTSYLHVASPFIHGLNDNRGSVKSLIRKVVEIGTKYPNGVGGIIKTARQLLFLRGDKSKIMNVSAENLHISGLEGGKLEISPSLSDWLFDLTGNRKSAINLANVFRIVAHPDADMTAVFEKVEGVKEPNRVEKDKMPRFEGAARKAIYSSLSKQRMHITAKPADPDDDITKIFVKSINSTSVPISNILKAGWTKWANIKFDKIEGIFDSEKQDIPVQNKSSAPSAMMSQKEINSTYNPKSYSEYRYLIEKLKSVNDIVTALDGTCELNFKKARERFNNVIKEHERFESEYKDIDKDDIPSEQLSDFVTRNPHASYTVTTEPKLGEVHKEIPRLFYMAEQALKIMTQVCERFTKKIISKASGISITKSFRARRKELEAMLNSYSGFIVDESGGLTTLFISFDMTEFSKKFPGTLIRAVGKILSELSGEDWMERVDLFFRASVVYHSSRGYISNYSGVRGGFEGFLNFLWTLCMKVVMDIAAQSTGVEGVLAVYSDDGLLRLYINGSKEEVRIKVKKIQEVFKSYGLIFHMDKTVASSEIMEYLGVYGECGMELSTWVKELMTIGKRKLTPGVETVSDKISLYSSQCNALANAGGDYLLCSFLSSWLATSVLRRLNHKAPSNVLTLLTVIPYSAGGFRTPSVTESHLTSSIDPLCEVGADLELIWKEFPAHANCIAEKIYQSLKCEKDSEGALLTGSLIQTNLPDTSGLGVVRRLIDRSTIEGTGVKNPMTKTKIKLILDDLKKARNFSPKPLRILIQAIPEMVEYNKSVAIIKSSAALKFCSRDDIRSTQAKDTRKCKKSIQNWVKYLTTYDGRTSRVSSPMFVTAVLNKCYPSYQLANFSESPRVAITVCENNAHILSSFEVTENEPITDQTYMEPIAKFLGAQLSPEFSAESTASTRQRRIERFVSEAARLVATNSSLIGIYYSIANAFELPCPLLSRTTVTSIHRSTRNFGFNCTAALAPKPYHALVNSRMSNIMYNKLGGDRRVDRTTYVESVKIPTTITFSRKNRFLNKLSEGVSTLNYVVRDLEINTSNPTLDLTVTPDCDLISDSTTKAFASTMVEENAQARSMESSIFSAGILETVVDSPSVKAIFLNRLESWLYSSILSGLQGRSEGNPTSVPTAWKSSIYIEATMSVAYKLSNALTRSRIARSIMSFVKGTSGISTFEALKDSRNLTKILNMLHKYPDSINNLDNELLRVGSALSKLDLEDELTAELTSININRPLHLMYLIDTIKRTAVEGGSSSPTVVINCDDFADSKMSKEVKVSIGRAVYMNLQAVLQKSVENSGGIWSDELDPAVNFLTVLRNMLRPSGHRNTPFNKHMVSIQLIKIELFIENCINFNRSKVDTTDLDNYRVPKEVIEEIYKQNAIIRGDPNIIGNTMRGTDMRECLGNQGIPSWALNRINYIIRRLASSYTPGFISKSNLMSDRLFFMKVMDGVMHDYNTYIKVAVKNLIIKHHREASRVTSSFLTTPVEDASMISASIDSEMFVGSICSTELFRDNTNFRDILGCLFATHYSRWVTTGYRSDPWVNDILISLGIFGNSDVTIPHKDENTIRPGTVESSYMLSFTRYDSKDKAANNYLYVNRLPGGMATCCSDDEYCYLIAIIPKGTMILNTDSTSVPKYYEGSADKVSVLSIKKTLAKLSSISAVLNISSNSQLATSDFGSLVIQQAYQRMIGARRTIIDNDATLVAIAEIASGTWSAETGLRVLALFSAWISSTGEFSMSNYRSAKRFIRDKLRSRLAYDRQMIQGASAAVFEWLKLSNIGQGPNINSEKVLSIVKAVGRSPISGGSISAIYNYKPLNAYEVTKSRGDYTVEDFITKAVSALYHIPISDYDEDLDIIDFITSDDDEKSD
jgi:uncharacterized protein YqgV (UPF0045/DUF77 family)